MDTQNEKGMAMLAYVLFFIPMLVSQNRSAFLNFHINQGLILFIVAWVGYYLFSMLNMYALHNIWGVLMFVLFIIGILGASKQEMKPLPIIGGLFTFIK